MKYVVRKERMDDDDIWNPLVLNHLQVDEATYTPTGILTMDGEMLYRCQLPIGFGRDSEW